MSLSDQLLASIDGEPIGGEAGGDEGGFSLDGLVSGMVEIPEAPEAPEAAGDPAPASAPTPTPQDAGYQLYQQWVQQQLQAQQQFQPPPAAPAEPQFPDYLNVEPTTEAEAAALQFARESFVRQQQMEQFVQAQQQQVGQQRVEGIFGTLEGKYKQQIPLEQRQEIAELVVKSGCQDPAQIPGLMEMAYRSVLFDQAQKSALERGQRLAQAKRQPAGQPPVGRVTPLGPAPAGKPKSIAEHFEAAWAQANG